jgi:hypothetical protein
MVGKRNKRIRVSLDARANPWYDPHVPRGGSPKLNQKPAARGINQNCQDCLYIKLRFQRIKANGLINR